MRRDGKVEGQLTKDQFNEAVALLGPKPPWWRPFKRRRWYATEWSLQRRRDDFPQCLARIYAAIKKLPE